jgi:hypothetical protein
MLLMSPMVASADPIPVSDNFAEPNFGVPGGTITEDLVISIASVAEHWPKVFSPVWSEDQT